MTYGGKYTGIILRLYIFLPAVEVLTVSVINIYRWISNCADHNARSIIQIDLDTSKIASSNDAVGEAGVAADTCNSNNTDHHRLLNDPWGTLKNSILQL